MLHDLLCWKDTGPVFRRRSLPVGWCGVEFSQDLMEGFGFGGRTPQKGRVPSGDACQVPLPHP